MQSHEKPRPLKIVVFDLDETLGYFVQFGIFWKILEEYKSPIKLTQCDFNFLLDLFPEFIRPNIYIILEFLKIKKKSGKCDNIMIYTNNQGPKEWAYLIKSYFEMKMNALLFDKIISAFKVNGEQIEFCRTTHNKTHGDFIKCTKVPENSQICFLDDMYHPEMKNDNVYYINIKPYVYDIPFEELIQRCIDSHYIDVSRRDNFKQFVIQMSKKYKYVSLQKSPEEYEIDKILTKQILHHIQIFFNKKTGNSITKRKKRYNNITIKNRK
jgi:hypothetical protein